MGEVNYQNFVRFTFEKSNITMVYRNNETDKNETCVIRFSTFATLCDHIFKDNVFNFNTINIPNVLFNAQREMKKNKSWSYIVSDATCSLSNYKVYYKNDRSEVVDVKLGGKLLDVLEKNENIDVRVQEVIKYNSGDARLALRGVDHLHYLCITDLATFILPQKKVFELYNSVCERINYTGDRDDDLLAFINRVAENGLMLNVDYLNYNYNDLPHALMTFKLTIEKNDNDIYWLTGKGPYYEIKEKEKEMNTIFQKVHEDLNRYKLLSADVNELKKKINKC